MRILWVKSDFLHPTTRGGQIRTLEMVRRLHQRHEVHYVAFNDPSQPEGLARAPEYCSHAYPIAHSVPDKSSIAFAGQLLAGLIDPLPVAISRYRSSAMRTHIEQLTRHFRFDCILCDFLLPAPNLPRLADAILFQHNVEYMIWKRHTENAPTLAHRLYFQLQAKRMRDYEALVCRTVRKVISVSEADSETMQSLYSVPNIPAVPTGVDLDYFHPPDSAPLTADLIFVGSMDWMPNIDAIQWFVHSVLPLIRRQSPHCSLAIVGRKPPPAIQDFARQDSQIHVTGTVPDVRPYMFGSRISIVPLRIGGGTRLKIYEAMAARLPVVSTTIGAEGLDIRHQENICIADTPEQFAAECVALLHSSLDRNRIAASAWETVSSRYSWDAVTAQFERLLVG